MKSFTKCLIILAVVVATIEAVEYRRIGSDGRQYYFNSDQKYNWYQAQHKCQQQNQQLLEISSSQKNNVLLPILRSLFKTPSNLWLGANDEYNESKDHSRPFYWSTSGQRMTFSYWSKNNPDNNNTREHCVHISRNESTYQWNDMECTSKMGYICEDNYVRNEKCHDLQTKRKNVSDISTNINANNQQRQKQQMQNLERGFRTLQQIDKQFGDVLLKVQRKLETDIKQLIMQNTNVIMAEVDHRNKSIQNSATEIERAVDKLNKEFSTKLQSSQKSIDDILKY